MNEKRVRLIIFIFTVALHLAVIFFIAFDTIEIIQPGAAHASVMQLINLQELPPPPPPPPPPPELFETEQIIVSDIAEVMIEAEVVPELTVYRAAADYYGEFLSGHQLSTVPMFDSAAIARSIVYPPVALRNGIEGRVVLDLFVDRRGIIQRIVVVREYPEDMGFGEAAVRVFRGRRGRPATVNGSPVAARFRYPVSFRIR